MTSTHSHHIDLDQPTRRRHGQRARSASRQVAAERLASADRPALARRLRPSHDPAPHRTLASAQLASPDELAGSNGGLLLLTFLAAILTVVGAVWLAAAVNQWWILIPVMAVDLLAATAVIASLFRLLSDS
jgi:hypothetical protein